MNQQTWTESRDPVNSELPARWDAVMTERKELHQAFYQFVSDAARIVGLPSGTAIVDVGCGTGRLLDLLSESGYANLAGVDLSEKAVEITRSRVSNARVFTHDIVQSPLPQSFNAAFMTEVIEHVSDPHKALSHLHQSLVPGGYLFLSFPNRLAYVPLLYLRWLRHLVQWWPWMRHWIMWFTMPYEMRSSQPIDNAYDPASVLKFVRSAGFTILQHRGMRLLPMFRIPGLGFTEAVVARLEYVTQRVPVQWWYYRSMFICKR